MTKICLLFILCILCIRSLAGYDSRFQNGRYIVIKNKILSRILLDSEIFYGRTKRLKNDRNKMSVRGLVYYGAACFVLVLNIILYIMPDVPCTPWTIYASRFFLYTDTINEKISAILIFDLFLLVLFEFFFVIIRRFDDIEERWLKIFSAVVSMIGILLIIVCMIFLVDELLTLMRNLDSGGFEMLQSYIK